MVDAKEQTQFKCPRCGASAVEGASNCMNCKVKFSRREQSAYPQLSLDDRLLASQKEINNKKQLEYSLEQLMRRSGEISGTKNWMESRLALLPVANQFAAKEIKISEALESVRTALAFDSGYAIAYVFAGHIHSLNGDYANAEKSYEKAVEFGVADTVGNLKARLEKIKGGDACEEKIADLPVKALLTIAAFAYNRAIVSEVAQIYDAALRNMLNDVMAREKSLAEKGQHCKTLEESFAARERALLESERNGEEKRIAMHAKEKYLIGSTHRLLQKAEGLVEKKLKLDDREKYIVETEQKLDAKIGIAEESAEALINREEGLYARERALAENEQKLQAQIESLKKASERLAQKEGGLGGREKELVAAGETLAKRESGLKDYSDELAAREKYIATRESQLELFDTIKKERDALSVKYNNSLEELKIARAVLENTRFGLETAQKKNSMLEGLVADTENRLANIVEYAARYQRAYAATLDKFFSCPGCGSIVGEGSEACLECGRVFVEIKEETAEQGTTKRCNVCNTPLVPKAKLCHSCGTGISEQSSLEKYLESLDNLEDG